MTDRNNPNEWRIYTWIRQHATHGTFFVNVLVDDTAGAARVTSSDLTGHAVEPLSAEPFANVALAMMACEKRIAELDQAIVDQTCADLRAYAAGVA
jgi:hypothetical protein